MTAHNSGSGGGVTNEVISAQNCGSLVGVTSSGPTVANGVELTVPNAVEMTWTMPFGVPSDRTEVSVDCSTT